MRRSLLTADKQRRELLATHLSFGMFVAVPITVSVILAFAVSILLPATFPAREAVAVGSRLLAVVIVTGAYVGVTFQLAATLFASSQPSAILGVGLVAMIVTSILPVALLVGGLAWAGCPDDVIARARWLFVALPGVQAVVWSAAATVGRFF